MPPTTETVANATASRVVALTTFPVTTRFCAGATDAAQRDSNVTADHEPLDITTSRTGRNRGTAYACRRVSRRAATHQHRRRAGGARSREQYDPGRADLPAAGRDANAARHGYGYVDRDVRAHAGHAGARHPLLRQPGRRVAPHHHRYDRHQGWSARFPAPR